jgi:hypothetical protein
MRLTIKSCNQPYIERLAASLNIHTSEALNFLLLTLQSQNYQIGTSIQQVIPPTLPTLQTSAQLGFNPDSNSSNFEVYNSDLAEKVDPIIERLVSLGICGEF